MGKLSHRAAESELCREQQRCRPAPSIHSSNTQGANWGSSSPLGSLLVPSVSSQQAEEAANTSYRPAVLEE